MKDKVLNCAVLIALVIVASVEGQRFLSATAAAQTPATRAGGLPMFQVDPPGEGAGKVEAWRRVQHRNRRAGSRVGLAPSADTASRSSRHGRTAVLVFDAEGNFNQAWGGPGSGYEWPERSTASISTIKASCGLAETIVPREPCPGSSRPETTNC